MVTRIRDQCLWWRFSGICCHSRTKSTKSATSTIVDHTYSCASTKARSTLASRVGLSPGHDLTARGEYSVLRSGTRPQSGLRRATTFADRRQKERQEQLVCVYRSPTNSRAPKLYAYLVELGAEGEETTTLWHVFACRCL